MGTNGKYDGEMEERRSERREEWKKRGMREECDGGGEERRYERREGWKKRLGMECDGDRLSNKPSLDEMTHRESCYEKGAQGRGSGREVKV